MSIVEVNSIYESLNLKITFSGTWKYTWSNPRESKMQKFSRSGMFFLNYLRMDHS